MEVQGVRMQYRCRLCGKTFFDPFDKAVMAAHASADRLLSQTIKDGTAEIGEHHASMIRAHWCGESKRGVADLIGYAPARGTKVTV